MSDLTVIYITANKISDHFANNVKRILKNSIGDTPLISVSKKPIDFGTNIISPYEISYISIYKDMLLGIKAANTKYIAIAEDDTLYTEEHFKHRPTQGKFAYNISCWNLYTWVTPAQYSYKGRRNNSNLICERELFIEALEERFKKYPNGTPDLSIWAEIGKYEDELKVTERQTEEFFTGKPNIIFNHPDGVSFDSLGIRKRMGMIRAYTIPYWTKANDLLKLYKL